MLLERGQGASYGTAGPVGGGPRGRQEATADPDRLEDDQGGKGVNLSTDPWQHRFDRKLPYKNLDFFEYSNIRMIRNISNIYKDNKKLLECFLL